MSAPTKRLIRTQGGTMKLPNFPQPLEIASHDNTIVVGVTDWDTPPACNSNRKPSTSTAPTWPPAS